MRRGGGGGVPARIWRDFIVNASKDLPERPLRDSDDGDLIAAGEIFQRVAAWFRALTGDEADGKQSDEELQHRRIITQVENWIRRNSDKIQPAPSPSQTEIE
jgi:membrane peptidoglycan carboxypeptidase